jgi:DNA repair protein RadA/Sms
MRARRLGLDPHGIHFSAETDLDSIVSTVEASPPQVLVIDSIQSVYQPAMESAHGSISQVREGTVRLHRLAKERDVATILIGHVTKEGAIAGPRVVEHLVDAVLYLEGERLQTYRLLRSVKNRFGATSEVGVFEMRDAGMAEVENPSAVFLADRAEHASGSVVFVAAEGTRPMLVEVQALAARTALAVPRRMTSGIDQNRVLLIAAVLSKRVGAAFHAYDIHVNVVGGLRIEETGADLATALAMLSSLKDRALSPDMVAIGEIGLAGELRGVGRMDVRLREAARLGFSLALVPNGTRAEPVAGIEVAEAATVKEAAALAGLQ